MKFLNEYNEIDWNFDYEEEYDSELKSELKVGDYVTIENLYDMYPYWSKNRHYLESVKYKTVLRIKKISDKHREDKTNSNLSIHFDLPYDFDFNVDYNTFYVPDDVPIKVNTTNESIDFEEFDFEEFDFEEFGYDDTEFEIIKYRYNDSYGYRGYRFWIKKIGEKKLIKFIDEDGHDSYDISENGIIYSTTYYTNNGLTVDEKNGIKNGTIWLTNSLDSVAHGFRKWKYSDLVNRINIINI